MTALLLCATRPAPETDGVLVYTAMPTANTASCATRLPTLPTICRPCSRCITKIPTWSRRHGAGERCGSGV